MPLQETRSFEVFKTHFEPGVSEADLATCWFPVTLHQLLSAPFSKSRVATSCSLDRKDTEGKFLGHVLERLDRAFQSLRSCKDRGLLGADKDTAESLDITENAAQSLELLHLLCEGHNTEFQNLLREQPKSSVQVNLVLKAADFLLLVVDSTSAVASFSSSQEELVARTIGFLTEAMEGPCPRNQELITTVEVINSVNAIVAAGNNIIEHTGGRQVISGSTAGSMSTNASATTDAGATVSDRVAVSGPNVAGGGIVDDGEENEDLRACACRMLAACLEGRHDTTTHEAMRSRLEMRGLGEYRWEPETRIRSLLRSADAEYRLLSDSELERLKSMQSALAAIATVALELEVVLPRQEAHDAMLPSVQTSLGGRAKSLRARKHRSGGFIRDISLAAASEEDEEDDEDEDEEEEEAKEGKRAAPHDHIGVREVMLHAVSSGQPFHHSAGNPSGGRGNHTTLTVDAVSDSASLEDFDAMGEDLDSTSSSEEDEGEGDDADHHSGEGISPLAGRRSRGHVKVGGESGIGAGLLGTCKIAWQGKIEREVFPVAIEF